MNHMVARRYALELETLNGAWIAPREEHAEIVSTIWGNAGVVKLLRAGDYIEVPFRDVRIRRVRFVRLR